MGKIKFSSKIEQAVLEELRSYSKSNNRNISDVLTEAVVEHLGRIRVRPIFKSTADQTIQKHRELLERLAK